MRRAKEQPLRSCFSMRMEKTLQSLAKCLAARQLKDHYKIEQQLGMMRARDPRVVDLYQVGVSEKGVPWRRKEM